MVSCEVFAGGAAALDEAPAWGRRLEITGSLAPLLEEIRKERDAGRDVCVLTSGDPGYFSLLGALEQAFPGEAVVEPGIASTQLLCARVGLPWTDVAHYSVHGRALKLSPMPDRPCAVLCDQTSPPQAVAAYLVEQGWKGQAVVGVSLGRKEERLSISSLEEAAAESFGSPAVLLVCPPEWTSRAGMEPRLRRAHPVMTTVSACPPGLPDQAFERFDGVPLSRWEIRAVLASVAQPQDRRIIWDVGAGSGGFAVELALASPLARVVAFERDPAGCRATSHNAHRHGARVEVVSGMAPATFAARKESPDLAVVGGSGGGLDEIVDTLADRLTVEGRLIVTAVTLETVGQAARLLRRAPWARFDALQLSSARLERGGIMKGMNPVTLLWADRQA
jgi:precorrin-6Y C5,15-methyltransferase (decarboxylating)